MDKCILCGQALTSTGCINPSCPNGRLVVPKGRPAAVPNGWVCPRCHKVWAPTEHGCRDCNEGRKGAG